MAKLAVDAEILCVRLQLPLGTAIVGVAMRDHIVEFEVAGPPVPDVERVMAIFTQTCKLEPA